MDRAHWALERLLTFLGRRLALREEDPEAAFKARLLDRAAFSAYLDLREAVGRETAQEILRFALQRLTVEGTVPIDGGR